MNALQMAMNSPFAEALGWTLFHSLWQGIIVALALAVVLMAVRSARVRYISGCVALMMMLGALMATAIDCLPFGAEGMNALKAPVSAQWGRLPELRADYRLDEFAVVIPWLAPLWLLGVCVSHLSYATAWVSTFRVKVQGVCNAPSAWQVRVNELAARLRVTRPVKLMESILVETPLLVGHVRPVILVPLGFLTSLTPAHVEAILLHEMAHIKRSDYLANLAQKLIEGLFFYHPAVWWISHVIRTERENCCDDLVVGISGNVKEYALALTLLEQNRLEQTAMAATGGDLMKRVKRLLYPKEPGNMWAPVLAAVILIASSTTVASAWREVTSPWHKWVNEDVVYIINSDEKTAFEKLKTDPERKHFIEQFWERRNPTPGSANNTFKEEHYRRIGYANNHWASKVPGWKTDRGRIYIKYGPPDEIDSHPNGGQYKRPASEGGDTVKTYPFEDWLYHKIDGVGTNVTMEFADTDHSGELRMTSDPNAKVMPGVKFVRP